MKRQTFFSPSPKQGVTHLSNVLPQLIVKYGLQQRKNVEEIAHAWRKAVGEPYGSVTRVIGLKRGILEVAVPHSTFVQELSFQQRELLTEIQTTLTEEKIKKIKFVVSN